MTLNSLLPRSVSSKSVPMIFSKSVRVRTVSPSTSTTPSCVAGPGFGVFVSRSIRTPVVKDDTSIVSPSPSRPSNISKFATVSTILTPEGAVYCAVPVPVSSTETVTSGPISANETVSMPAPPSVISEPPPPEIKSSPSPPRSVFAAAPVAINTSSLSEPVRFSMPVKVSLTMP